MSEVYLVAPTESLIPQAISHDSGNPLESARRRPAVGGIRAEPISELSLATKIKAG